jgi:AcrR family transcriptional regulator
MSLVAETAGVAKGTLYNYFPDKGALVAYVIFKSAEPLADRVEEIASGEATPAEQLAAIARCVFDTVAEHQELISLAMQERLPHPPPEGPEGEMRQMRLRVRKAVTAIIERGIAEKAFRKVPAAMTAHIFMASLTGLAGSRIMAETDHSPQEDVEHLMSVIIHGIVTPEGSRGRAK